MLRDGAAGAHGGFGCLNCGFVAALLRVRCGSNSLIGGASLKPNHFWFKEFIDHRDPHLLGPPLRPDPQSYSALSDYLLTYKLPGPTGSELKVLLKVLREGGGFLSGFQAS